jgi:septal ring-binding cell division protein DamX
VLSGLFFTLGYVMGRNQSAGEVRAADFREKPELPAPSKPEVNSKHANKSTPADTPTDTAAPANSDWEFYHAGDSRKPEDRLKPVATSPAPAKKTEPVLVKTTAAPRTPSTAAPKNNANGQGISGGTYTLQVAAMTREADALELAKRLQQKKFPAFVLSPQGDKYYRVQVGPYADPKAADAARKGLESAGFKAFVKH